MLPGCYKERTDDIWIMTEPSPPFFAALPIPPCKWKSSLSCSCIGNKKCMFLKGFWDFMEVVENSRMIQTLRTCLRGLFSCVQVWLGLVKIGWGNQWMWNNHGSFSVQNICLVISLNKIVDAFFHPLVLEKDRCYGQSSGGQQSKVAVTVSHMCKSTCKLQRNRVHEESSV